MRFVPNTWMDSLADEVLKDPFFRKNTVPAVMKTDIREREDGYLLDIELPGFKKEEIKMELEDGYLTIAAAHFIGEEMNVEDIKARYENGELKVFVPKKDPQIMQTKKTISID